MFWNITGASDNGREEHGSVPKAEFIADLSDENRERLLELAGQHTAHDLEVILRGEEPVEDAKVARFYLAPPDYNRLRAALLKHGAVVSGNGLANVEPALMALIDKVETAA